MNHFPTPNPDNIKATLIEWERIAYNNSHPQIALLCDAALQHIISLEEEINVAERKTEEAIERIAKFRMAVEDLVGEE